MAFFHRGRSVYVDFHGKWSHEGESNIHHDSLRANAFSQLGMAYYLLTKDQVFSVSLLEKFVQQLRMRLRIYPKTTITDLPKRQHALHRKVIRMVHERSSDSFEKRAVKLACPKRNADSCRLEISYERNAQVRRLCLAKAYRRCEAMCSKPS